ncbi:MAG: 7-cyano-7-deazaguanine synthase QueC [Candidatus Cloacimonetes bacterium]|nr:7-cyano-7-deazaguanine synthase QueC [Candidatus Cloacimonadota bacterium]
MTKKGILLLSGGADSTTLFVHALEKGWTIYPLSVDYGQKHAVELEAAKQIVDYYRMFYYEVKYRNCVKDLKVLNFDLSQIGHSALTDETQEVPNSMKNQIQTVVPFRNTLLATLAAAYGESLELNPITIFMTPVKEDFETYRDCRIPFYHSLTETLRLGSTRETEIEIITPFIGTTKAEIIALGTKYKVPYELTHTCYKGTRPACGKCPACIERLEAFKTNSLKDPLEYEKE